MVHSSFLRYYNLVKNISNWPAYFSRKFDKEFKPLTFVTRGNKIRFDVPIQALYYVFKEIFVSDFYDIKKMVKKLPKAPVVIDIGANAGYFNVILFSKLKTATVYAYEPIKSNYELFKKNISLNSVLKKGVHLFNKAVTGTPQGDIELFMETESDNSVIASVYADFDKQNQHIVKVPTISLEEIIRENNLQKIDLIKIDCEGSEYPILYETPANIWQQVSLLTIEVHNLDDEKRNVNHLKTYLESHGFAVQIAHAHTTCYTMDAQR